jgi:hypothetical protein
LVALSVWLATSASVAQSRRVLALLSAKPPDFWPRLSAELDASGFAVQTAEVSAEPLEPSQIEGFAARARVNIGLSPLESGRGLQIWLVDPVSHRLAFREVILGLYTPSDSPDVIAVRMVETLRATLMDLQQERRVVAEPPPPPPPAPVVEPQRSVFTLGLGGAGVVGPGGLGAIGLLQTSLAGALGARFSLVLDGALTPVAVRFHRAEGSASLSWYMAGAALRFGVTEPAARLSLRSSAGVWVAHLTSRGQAAPGFSDAQSSSNSAVPHVDLGLRWSLTPRLGFGADAAVGFSAPGVDVAFAGRQVATWGRPLWLGRLQLEAALD